MLTNSSLPLSDKTEFEAPGEDRQPAHCKSQSLAGWAGQCSEAAASSVVAARAAHVTLQGLRMTAPGLLSCSSFPALLALFIALLISLLSVNPTEASCKLSRNGVSKHLTISILPAGFTQDHFMNLKFNRSLFRDVSRECSLEGKFEAVINRNNPAYLLKLDGKDNTVFSQQVSRNTQHGD